MERVEARLLVDCRNLLGEGVQWRIADQRVYWTDIHGAKLLSCREDGSDLKVLDLPERLGSFAFDPDGMLVAAFASGFWRFDPATGRRDLLSAVQPGIASTRMNDGRCDSAGRFVAGGIDEDGLTPIAEVLAFDGAEVRTLISGVGCTNSITFSGDGKTMYFADSPTRQILVHDYDPASGTLGERRVFARLGEDEGVPDGSCVDAEDALWNARFGGSCVQRYRPDGAPDLRIDLPVGNVTCACFGGAKLDKLFITTASVELTDAERAAQPTAGGLYVADTGHRGRPEREFARRVFA